MVVNILGVFVNTDDILIVREPKEFTYLLEEIGFTVVLKNGKELFFGERKMSHNSSVKYRAAIDKLVKMCDKLVILWNNNTSPIQLM